MVSRHSLDRKKKKLSQPIEFDSWTKILNFKKLLIK